MIVAIFFLFFLNNKHKLEKMIAALVTVNNNVNATSIQTKKKCVWILHSDYNQIESIGISHAFNIYNEYIYIQETNDSNLTKKKHQNERVGVFFYQQKKTIKAFIIILYRINIHDDDDDKMSLSMVNSFVKWTYMLIW